MAQTPKEDIVVVLHGQVADRPTDQVGNEITVNFGLLSITDGGSRNHKSERIQSCHVVIGDPAAEARDWSVARAADQLSVVPSVTGKGEKLLLRCSWRTARHGKAAIFVVKPSQVHFFVKFRLQGRVN